MKRGAYRGDVVNNDPAHGPIKHELRSSHNCHHGKSTSDQIRKGDSMTGRPGRNRMRAAQGCGSTGGDCSDLISPPIENAP